MVRWCSYNESIGEGEPDDRAAILRSAPFRADQRDRGRGDLARSRNPEGSKTQFFSQTVGSEQERSLWDWKPAMKSFRGEVVFLELTRYFGELPAETLETLGRDAGFEWKRTLQLDSLRLLYGEKTR